MARKNDNSGVALGLLAALCWSIHFPFLFHYIGDFSPFAFYFHCAFWAAIASNALLTITGRMDELSLVNRKSGTMFLLILTGGYGLWVLMANAISFHAGAGGMIELLFYSGPMFLIFLTLFTKNGAQQRRTRMSVMGFLGVLLVLYNSGRITAASLLVITFSVTAALLWAIFSLTASDLLQKREVLPALAITLSATALCLFLTCIAMGIDLLAIPPENIWVTMMIGVVSLAGGMGLWMKCMQMQNVASNAATWWYGAIVFGSASYFYLTDVSIGPIAIFGMGLILFSFKSAGSKKERTKPTFGDLVSK